MTKETLFRGYQRKGKRLIPPMKQLQNLRECSYVDDMLPELIWLGLINERKGYPFGSAVLETIVETIGGAVEPNTNLNVALQSAYEGFDEDQKDHVVKALRDRELLEDAQQALAPLLLLYDGFALMFLGPPADRISEAALIERIKRCVGNHLDRSKTPAIVLHGSLMLTRLVAGTVHVSKEIDLPDLNSVVTRPDSEEAKRAAGFLRASAMAEWGALNVNNRWAEYFWNRGGELTPCELPDWLEEDE